MSEVWVSSELSEPGSDSYVVAVRYDSADRFAMDELAAHDYADSVIAAACAADYESRIVENFVGGLGMPMEDAASVLDRLRKERGTETWEAGPLRLTPGISVFDRSPFLVCEARAGLRWQWAPDEARQHAMQVKDVAWAAKWDGHYLRLAQSELDLPYETALRLVSGSPRGEDTAGG